MLNKFSLLLIGAASFLCVKSFAITTDFFRQGNGVEYILAVNEPLHITNPFMWSVKAVCTMSTEKTDENFIAFKVLRKSGSLNGVSLNTGDSMTVHIHTNDMMYINAQPGAQVELVNIGEEVIKATCSVA